MEFFEDVFNGLARFANRELGFSIRASGAFAMGLVVMILLSPFALFAQIIRSSRSSRGSSSSTDHEIRSLKNRVEELERKLRNSSDKPKS
jgi:hypothetical protein